VPVSQFSVGTDPNKTRLAKDISSLLDPNGTENFSDVTLVGAEGAREFRCHKIVLHRLPVLRRLIKESSAGGDDGALRLKLDGVPDHLLEHVVEWLYGQPLSAELSLSVLVQLATVAKRQLGSAQLQQACESTFGMGLNCVSVCQRLEDLASFDVDEREQGRQQAGDGVDADLSHLQLTAADLRGFYERCFTLIARNWDLLKKDRQPELRSLEALACKHSPRVAALLKGDTRAAAAAVAEAKQSDAQAEAKAEQEAATDQEDNEEDGLADSLLKFVDNPLYSDVKLVVEGHPEVHAHRAILCARSSYFRAMLTLGMREATDGVIQIRDLSRETLMTVLRYIYAAEYYHPSLLAHPSAPGLFLIDVVTLPLCRLSVKPPKARARRGDGGAAADGCSSIRTSLASGTPRSLHRAGARIVCGVCVRVRATSCVSLAHFSNA
jgi:hypothetical protein